MRIGIRKRTLFLFTLISHFAFSSEDASRVSILDNLLFLLHEHIQVTNDSESFKPITTAGFYNPECIFSIITKCFPIVTE